MEMFWLFQLRFHRGYDSVYDSDFWFSPGHKHYEGYTYDPDPVISENTSLKLLHRVPETPFFIKFSPVL